MYDDQILINTVAVNNRIIKRSYSNKDLLKHENLCSLPRHQHLEQSSPVSLKNDTSFAQFIAEEKNNLQFFPSFRKTGKLAANKKKIITNFQSLPRNILNKYYAAFNNSNIFDSDQTASCVSNSSNFSISTSNESKKKQAKSITRIHTEATLDTLNVNRRRRIRCIERNISYMNNDQTKTALGFILQLNTYFNQNSLLAQKKSNIYCEQIRLMPAKSIELRTTSSLDFISTSHFNDVDLVEAKDIIDISLQLSNHFDALSPLVLKENDHLLTLYSRPITDAVTMKTNRAYSNDWSLDDETGLYSVLHLSLEKEGKSQNQQGSARTSNTASKKDTRTNSRTTGFSCCCRSNSKNRIEHVPINHTRIQTELKEKKELEANVQSKLDDQTADSLLLIKTFHNSDISTVPMQENEMLPKLLEHREVENSKSNETEINNHQQSTMINSSSTDSNYHFRKSSADLQNLTNGFIEQKSSIPLHSRCLVSLELANREEHRIEIVELPRLFHRVSRIDTYQQLRERLKIVDLIDIDPTALLRSILHSFS